MSHRLSVPEPFRPGELLIIGETAFRGRRQRFGLLPEDRLRHVAALGKSGVGKSTLLQNLIIQDMEAGRGLALLDPHGDLAVSLLPHVPPRRIADVIYFDPGDQDYPIAWNVFRSGRQRLAPATAASFLVSVFRRQWRDSWGPRLEHVLRNGVLAVAESEQATLFFLYQFLTDKDLREKYIPKLVDPVVKKFWFTEFGSWSDSLKAEALAPVLNKLGAFLSHPISRNIFVQERSRLDWQEALDRKRIVIANLSTGSVGEDVSHILGSLLLSSLLLSASGRPRGGPAFYAYVDEFHHFVNDSLSSMLAEARKYGLGLILAHQYLTQLPESIREAMTGNVGTRIIFRVGAEDARVLEPDFLPPFTAFDLQSLGRFQMIVRLLARGQELHPFSAETLSAQIARKKLSLLSS